MKKPVENPVEMLLIPKEHVVSMNILPIRQGIATIGNMGAAMGKSFAGMIRVDFEGWEDDSREPWEIPEVRDYVMKVLHRVPNFLYFLERSQHGIQKILLCIGEVRDLDQENIAVFFDKHLMDVVTRNTLKYAESVDDLKARDLIAKYLRSSFPLRKEDEKKIFVPFAEEEIEMLSALIRDALGSNGDFLLPEDPDIREKTRSLFEGILQLLEDVE